MMNIFELLQEPIVGKRYPSLSTMFDKGRKEELDTEEDKEIFDIFQNIVEVKIKVTEIS